VCDVVGSGGAVMARDCGVTVVADGAEAVAAGAGLQDIHFGVRCCRHRLFYVTRHTSHFGRWWMTAFLSALNIDMGFR
jgi:hypothetical protein